MRKKTRTRYDKASYRKWLYPNMYKLLSVTIWSPEYETQAATDESIAFWIAFENATGIPYCSGEEEGKSHFIAILDEFFGL